MALLFGYLQQKSYLENVNQEALPTQTTEQHGETRAASSLGADSPPGDDEDNSLSEIKVSSSDEPFQDPSGDVVESSTISQVDCCYN